MLQSIESSKILSMIGQEKEDENIAAAQQTLFSLQNLISFNSNKNRKACIQDLPHSLMQKKVFMLFTSKELFKLRLVCTEWNDLIKTIWCQIVKDEMLE